MRTPVLLLLALTALSGFSQSAEARDGCGPGWYFNGYTCRPMAREYRGPRYYGPPPYAERRYYGNPSRPIIGRDGRAGCPNPRWTIQDGVCKPYRGF